MAGEPTDDAAGRLLVAGPNLTVDRTIRLDELRAGEVLRAEHVTVTPGGKGLNVARAAEVLGRGADLVGFVPGRTGAAAAGMIADEGVTLRSVPYDGEIRSAAVLREHDGRTTVINEPGPALTPQAWSHYESQVEAGLERGSGALVCSGSCPPGAPEDGYARLVGRARAQGAISVLDAGGVWLAGGVTAGPDVAAPNLAEAEALLEGGDREAVDAGTDAGERALRSAAALHARGVAIAVVTAADAGVAAVSHHGSWWVPAPAVAARNPVGAGDAFTAALTLALMDGRSLQSALRAAVATAAASVESELGGVVDPGRARQLESEVPPPQPS